MQNEEQKVEQLTETGMAQSLMLGEVDITKLNEAEFMSLGLKLMRKSLQQIFNMDAKEHADYELYMQELDRRRANFA